MSALRNYPKDATKGQEKEEGQRFMRTKELQNMFEHEINVLRNET